MIPSSIGRERILTNPKTGKKFADTVIREEIHIPADGEEPYDYPLGSYVFGAWLEESKKSRNKFLISFPYWRNGRFAGQYTIRAEVSVVKSLFKQMQRKGWFKKKDWS